MEEVKEHYTELENEFSAGHTNLQEIRMNNETLLDEMRQREYKLKKLDREIKEKATLIQMIEKKMAELKRSK